MDPKHCGTTLLVTVGSTLFSKLTDAIFASQSLEYLCQHVSILRVQIGGAQFPEPSALRSGGWSDGSAVDKEVADHVNGDSLRGQWRDMEIEVFRYTTDFEGLVKSSDMVISHAGSGSILTTLRAGKPLLVVPNTDLMDNHQEQLAAELEKGGYLHVSTVENLTQALASFVPGGANEASKRLKPFPGFEASRFRGIMDEMMGFNEDRL